MKNIYDVLSDLNITYVKYEHPAVFTVEEAEKYDQEIVGGKCKNLFLKNKKDNTYYLLITESTKKIDFKKLSILLNGSRLSFASPAELKECLGLTPGSVSPFGLVNDNSQKVKVLIDKNLLKYDQISFHPNINTATLVIKTEYFKKISKMDRK